jgi:hypothetical protein
MLKYFLPLLLMPSPLRLLSFEDMHCYSSGIDTDNSTTIVCHANLSIFHLTFAGLTPQLLDNLVYLSTARGTEGMPFGN